MNDLRQAAIASGCMSGSRSEAGKASMLGGAIVGLQCSTTAENKIRARICLKKSSMVYHDIVELVHYWSNNSQIIIK